MNAPAAGLARSDFLRAPVLATARPDGYKEWHHFVVHRPGWRLLVNFNLTSENRLNQAPRLVPRVIVIAHQRSSPRHGKTPCGAALGRRFPARSARCALASQSSNAGAICCARTSAMLLSMYWP